MAAFASTHTSAGFAPVANRFATVFASPVQAIRDWNNARLTRNVLGGLTDRELNDIGLIRNDIETVATSR